MLGLTTRAGAGRRKRRFVLSRDRLARAGFREKQPNGIFNNAKRQEPKPNGKESRNVGKRSAIVDGRRIPPAVLF